MEAMALDAPPGSASDSLIAVYKHAIDWGMGQKASPDVLSQ